MSEPAADLHDYTPTVPKIFIALAWLWVALPFGYGVYQLLLKVSQLFS